jgi:heptosyltransferase-2
LASLPIPTPPKILILGPAWVGDMVLAQSLFKILKTQQPNCRIDVAAPPWTLPLLDHMPEVDNGISLPFKHREFLLLERIKFGRSLRHKEYTQAIILTNSFKSAIVPFFANIPQRTSFLGEMRYGLINDIRPLNKLNLPRTVDRFVTLGLPFGTSLPAKLPEPALISNKNFAFATLKKLGVLTTPEKIIGLCPGAEYGEAKCWPAEYYAEVAIDSLSKGFQVFLFGSLKDSSITQKVNLLTGNRCLDLGGKTSLSEAINLISLCDSVVSNDSGLMHITSALDKRLIAIYGSSTPVHTPPMCSKTVIEYLNLACSPCFKRVCPLYHLNCLKNISSARVISDLYK